MKRPESLQRTTIDPRGPEAFAAPPPSPKPPPTTPEVVLKPGLKIQQYELIRELGRGGMGQVFLARDTRLGRRVAMKFLVSASKKFTDRFVVEARATARCNHENIVVIHDVETFNNLPYMVLEYVEGASLAKLMQEKRLPVGRAIELVVPIVKALVAAHAATIVHRDLKPDNIIVSTGGTVKVLDFGIAKLYEEREEKAARSAGIVGTLPYMSPEQLGTDDVDHRSDLWAIGIILYEMLAGKHPLDPLTQGKLFGAAASDDLMPSLADDVSGLPDRIVAIVARCLAKKKQDRYPTASALLAELEPLLPRSTGRHLVEDESPYPGLNAFQESDADRFFGRSQDIAGAVARLRDQPMIAIVGPSGTGKSSFVRAGVVPALKASGDAWECIIVRPGRQPLIALASALEQLRESRDSDVAVTGPDLAAQLRTEPGALGARLRARARRRRSQILLFIDQHEELYTLVPDAEERQAFTACLAGAADDSSGPIRVVVAMRSDFLDRAAEDRRFVEEISRGLIFLQPPNRVGLDAALTQPLEALGFSFEPGIVQQMLATLEATPGPLPLLQFTAAKLWDARDRQRRVLTQSAYDALGGVAGALATHADEVIAGFAPGDARLVRLIFQQLVTPERTRAIVDVGELRELGGDVDRILGQLVAARLLVVHSTAVELVHESLIKSWPTLRRWLDENQEDAAFLAQVKAAAQQWDHKGRVEGLLWRNEAMVEARVWRAKSARVLPPREDAFLTAVFELANRTARTRRRRIVGAFAFLCVLVAAAAVALVWIRSAEQRATDEAMKTKTALAANVAAQRESEKAHRLAEQASQAAADSANRAAAAAKNELAQKLRADSLLVKTKTLATENEKAKAAAAASKQVADKATKTAAQIKADAEKKQEEQRGKIAHGSLR